MTSNRYRFELLAASHDVSGFICEHVAIYSFLRNDALRETQMDRTRTYVLIDSEADHSSEVIGFFTLLAHSFAYESNTFPVVEIAWIARHQRMEGKRIGDKLLAEAFRYIEQASRLIAVEGVSLSETSQGKRLYDRFNFGEHPHRGSQRFLHINDIRSFVSALQIDT